MEKSLTIFNNILSEISGKSSNIIVEGFIIKCKNIMKTKEISDELLKCHDIVEFVDIVAKFKDCPKELLEACRIVLETIQDMEIKEGCKAVVEGPMSKRL